MSAPSQSIELPNGLAVRSFAPAAGSPMSAKDYCSKVCGAKCCKAHGPLIWPKACPALTKDNLCSQYERRFSVTFEGLKANGEKILCGCCKPEAFIPNLPPEVRDQCCFAHPELLENDGTQRPGSPDGSLATESRKPGSLK